MANKKIEFPIMDAETRFNLTVFKEVLDIISEKSFTVDEAGDMEKLLVANTIVDAINQIHAKQEEIDRRLLLVENRSI